VETVIENEQSGKQVQKQPSKPMALTTRKAYARPVLTAYGDVRDLTLAPTPGEFESGPGLGFKG
jgi:hypothetical protein